MSENLDKHTKPANRLQRLVRVCADCGGTLGSYLPCWICGGDGHVLGEDFFDAGMFAPGEDVECSYCEGSGEKYDPDYCDYCEEEAEYERR